MKKLLCEDDVKNKLKINDFRSIKKKQLIDFVSSIPDMDKDVAIACIEQFPNFKEYSSSIVEGYYELCKISMENDSIDSLNAYREILDSLKDQLNRENISEEERRFIIEKLVEIGNCIENVDDKKRDHKELLVKLAASLGGFAITIGGSLLGAKLLSKKD